MFDGFLMSITNKLKKISASLDLYEGKFDEISADVGAVNTAVSAKAKEETVVSLGSKIDVLQSSVDELSSNSSDTTKIYVSSAGSTTLSTICSSSTVAESSIKSLGRVRIIGFEGYLRIYATLKVESTGRGGAVYVYINDFDNVYCSIVPDSTSSKSYTKDIYVKDGDVLKFSLRYGSTTTSAGTAYYDTTCTSLTLRGTISESAVTPAIISL